MTPVDMAPDDIRLLGDILRGVTVDPGALSLAPLQDLAGRANRANGTRREVLVTGLRTLYGDQADAILVSLAKTPVAALGEPVRPIVTAPTWPSPMGGAAFHGLAGDFVRMLEPHTEADPVALLIQFLVGFGNMVGRGPHILVEADEHHACLFAVMAGASAKARKGTSWSHVRRLLVAADPSWEPRIASGLSSGEGLIWAVRDPVFSTKPSRKKGEASVGIEDAGEDDKRILSLESEFASVLRVMEREGNTLSAIIRQAWDNGRLATLVKHSQNRASGAHVGIIGHITSDELLRYLTRTESGNGFANRILWILVKRSKELPFGGSAHQLNWAPMVRSLTMSLETARATGQVEMDDGARELWASVYHDLTADRPGMLGAVTGRLDPQTLRIALIYALLDGVRTIRRHHLEAALAVVRYSLDSCRIIFGNAVGDPVADEILQALKDKPEGMTRTEIRDFFGRHQSDKIGRALLLLQEKGLVRMEAEKTGGRSAERWFACDQSDRSDRSLLVSAHAPATEATKATEVPSAEIGDQSEEEDVMSW